MIVRNLDDPEVLETTYIAHGGAVARMLMTSPLLQGMEFLAHAILPPGNAIEEHVDPVEEIYYILKGGGIMRVGDERREVKEGDAIWIPQGSIHGLHNNTSQATHILVIAAYPRRVR
ncbi:MAG: cupin domain-containing protein [Deltaproteobacteria bacterium]|nr:MAG: cupin domain-containing protein [Deltaproteobacteria bacterium]